MKKAVYLVLAVVFTCSLGCGPSATDTSDVPPAPTAEDTTQEIEKAMESGEIDPQSYGKY
jgi:hypothetical protein